MDDGSPHPTASRRAVLQRLESLGAAGVDFLPTAVPSAPVCQQPTPSAPHPSVNESATAPSQAEPQPAASASLHAGTGGSAASTLQVLAGEVVACTACQELASTRTQTVFGVGSPTARLCFMGEAPGADEDRLGEPFVGRAGQLLDRMLSACGLAREEVYILNVLKCRPPGNRNPTPDEARSCRPFLRRQLELIDPEYICCLGAVAAQNFLATTSSIGRLRGRIHEHEGRKVVCTYHPAYLLRNPSAKKDAWEDLKMLMRQLGVEL